MRVLMKTRPIDFDPDTCYSHIRDRVERRNGLRPVSAPFAKSEHEL